MRHSLLKFSDEANRVFYSLFGIGTQGPVAKSEPSPNEINQWVEREQELVANVTRKRQPLHILHHGVELMAMNNKNALSSRGDVNIIRTNLDIPVAAAKVCHQLIVIARNVNNPSAFSGFTQNFLN